MSNSASIAAVTTALGQRIAQALSGVANLSASPGVRLGVPVVDASFVGVNLFLYRAYPSGSRRNIDLATRSPDGTLIRHPQAAVDLDYLISFHGDEATLEPQRLLGAVVVALQAAPILTAGDVNNAIVSSGEFGPLAAAAYDETAEAVRLVLQPQDMEITHRLWALFPSTPYSLSVVYAASVVVMDAELPISPAPPATEVVITAAPDLSVGEVAITTAGQDGLAGTPTDTPGPAG
jgi:hypothetical protein